MAVLTSCTSMWEQEQGVCRGPKKGEYVTKLLAMIEVAKVVHEQEGEECDINVCKRHS